MTPVEADDLEEALYARMRWNVPLSVEHAELLTDRLDVRPGAPRDGYRDPGGSR